MSAPAQVDRRIDEVVERAAAVVKDRRLEGVARWKQRTGGLAVGFTPIYAPREVLHAMNVLPVGLMGAGDDLEIIRGDAYYQSYICHIPRSTIELALNGSLDPLDGMLFPAICDVIRNLSGMWKMMFKDKLVRYLDVPQDFDRDRGAAFWRGEIVSLCAELAERGWQVVVRAAGQPDRGREERLPLGRGGDAQGRVGVEEGEVDAAGGARLARRVDR